MSQQKESKRSLVSQKEFLDIFAAEDISDDLRITIHVISDRKYIRAKLDNFDAWDLECEITVKEGALCP